MYIYIYLYLHIYIYIYIYLFIYLFITPTPSRVQLPRHHARRLRAWRARLGLRTRRGQRARARHPGAHELAPGEYATLYRLTIHSTHHIRFTIYRANATAVV